MAVIVAGTHCSLSLTFLPSNVRAVGPCLSVVLRGYYIGYIAMCYGSYTGHVFSFVIRRYLCCPSRDFPAPVYLFVVILDGGSGSRVPFVNCLVFARSLYHSTALPFVTRHLYWACFP